MNLYFVVFSAKCATEAEDDIYRQIESVSDAIPTRNYRRALIRSLQIFPGLVYVPLCIWLYTYHIELLWGPEQRFWFQPGFFLGGLCTVAGFLLIPRYAPGLARSISRLESRIGDYFSRSG